MSKDSAFAEKARVIKEVGENPFEMPRQKEPVGLKILGWLCIIGSVAMIPQIVMMATSLAALFNEGLLSSNTNITQALCIVLVVFLALTTASFLLLGIRLVLNKRRGARQSAEVIIVMLIIDMLCHLMISGMQARLLVYLALAVVLIIMLTHIDPTLTEERHLQRKLRNMETRESLAEGTLGLDKTGRGYIALDFFNLFWIFVIASILGDLLETADHMIFVDPGVYQDRAGLLWGPFSPIYGVGAILMTIALNRFHKANIVVIFLVSAVIGGAFEYFVSWFLQFAFGVTAWDYTGTFLSIGGRTNFHFMCIWGILGIVWSKLLLPLMLWVVNLIPWKLRYTITAVCAGLMLVDAALTLITLDCWYSRLAGIPSDNALMQFCDQHFDNDWMANRFQSMSIDPNNATRAH